MAVDQYQPRAADGLSRHSSGGRPRSCAGSATSIPPRWCARLSISQQQLVEIAKALTLDCRVLILDEPTAALTEREAQILFDIMRKLAAQGISIIYISHRMVEIFDNCDRVTVLRDGQYITTMNVAETTPGEVVSAMVGRVIDNLYPPKQRADERSDEIILEVRDLTERTRFRDVSFQLAQGRDPRSRRPDRRRPQRDRQGHLPAGGRGDRRGARCTGAAARACGTMATASPRASSTCPRTARATGCSSTCRSPPTSRRCRVRAGRGAGRHHRRPARDRAGRAARRPAQPQMRPCRAAGVGAVGRQPAEGGDRQDAVGRTRR